MAKFGSIGEFNPSSDDWDVYIERFKLFCTVNKITAPAPNAAADVADDRVPLLLTVIGGEAYKRLRALTSPTNPATKKFDDLVVLMKN